MKTSNIVLLLLGLLVLLLCVCGTVLGGLAYVGKKTVQEAEQAAQNMEKSTKSYDERSRARSYNPFGADGKTYVNQEAGVQISYPSDYTTKENFMGTVVAIISPQEGSSDDFRENLNVLEQDLLDSSTTLEEYTQLNMDQLQTVMNDFHLIRKGDTTLAGHPAYEVVYTASQGQIDAKYHQVWTVVDDRAYIITATGTVQQYDNYSAVFDDMIASFEIL